MTPPNTISTRAAVLYETNSPFQVEVLDLAPPQAGEVLVKVAATGVCRSDWQLVTGATQHPLPLVPGHEGAGVVEDVGEGVTCVGPGDPVILNWAPSCGTCFYCLNERPSLCATYVEPIWAGTMMDGTPRLSKNGEPVYHYCALACFSEYAVVPQESCVPLQKEVPLRIGAVIGCAVTTGVGAVLNKAQVRAGSSVAVFGAGGVGLSTVLGASLAGARPLIAIDTVTAKEKVATELGATHFLTADGTNSPAAIRDLTEGRGADYVFDTTGVPAVQEQCLEAVRPGGTVVLSGLAPMGTRTNLPGAILTRQEKTVTGSYYGSGHPPSDFRRYAELYLEGKLDLDRLISKTYSLDQINIAFADLVAGKLARGVVVF
jgi:S-(hydroxymethyl)glutathione dehydrogenase/alcohol dehydrogenase